MQKGFEVVNLHGTASGVIAVPVIGENGNWWIGNEDTGIKAQGEPGPQGEKGEAGLSPTIGSNGNWFIGDMDTGVHAGGVPAPNEAKWADLQVGTVTMSTAEQLIHFDRATSKTNMQINATGNLIVPPGLYMMGFNYMIHSKNNTGSKFINGHFYNVTDKERFGGSCGRLLNMTAATSSDSNFIWKFEKETEICLKGETSQSLLPVVLGEVYGYIFEIGKGMI